LIDFALLKNLFLVALLTYVLIGVGLVFFQRSFIYFPTRPVSLAGLSDVELSTEDDVRLLGHVGNDGRESLILYFGGNAEQIAYSLLDLSQRFPGFTVVGFHYRGYAGSEGEPRENDLYRDALFLYDELAENYDHVVVIGRSLGSGVATQLAAERRPNALVLVTPFDSIESLAKRAYWFYPVSWMVQDKYDSFSRAAKIATPTLLLLAENDQIVPRQNSERLYSAFTEGTASMKVVADTSHNTISESAAYYSTLDDFFVR